MDGVPEDDPQRLTNLELQAGEANSYYVIYHVSLNNQEHIYQSFVDFAGQILTLQANAQRTFTEDFLENDKTVKMPAKKTGGPSLAA